MPGRASSPVKKAFGTPYMGVMNTLPEHETDPHALWAAFNCVYGLGRVITRRSMVKLSLVTTAFNLTPDTRILGCFSTNTSDGHFDIYASSWTNLYRLRDLTGAWTDISGSLTLTNNDTHTPRWASLYDRATGKTLTVMVNGIDDAVQSLDGGNFTTLVVGGEKGIDICTVASRFMAIIPPYRVRWSDIYAGTFPALNFYTGQDTPGKVVAVRNLGTLGACIYKEDAIITAYSQPGSPANAFRFEVRREVPGPAGPNAVVTAEGSLFHMTARGRIGAFDGTRFEWVGDGVWNYMLSDFDFSRRTQTHGFYDEAYGHVWFVYPRVSDAGNGPTGLVIVTLPRPAWGVPTYGVWPGAFAKPASCSNTLRLTSGYVGLVMRSDSGQDEAEVIVDPLSYASHGDDGNDFSAYIHTGLQPMGDISSVEIEPFLTKAPDSGECTLAPVTSHTLDTDGGTLGTAQTIDLEDATVIHGVKGFPVTAGRFVGLRVSWQSRAPVVWGDLGGRVQYKGAVIYGHPLEQP
jgi:hypothetical protein